MKTTLTAIALILFFAGFSGVSEACSSDFSCSIGYKCLKKQYSSTGYCAKSVDEYGTPTYNMPSTDSVGPKMDDDDMCSWDTDCSIGFKCRKSSGALKGYCVK